MFQHGFTYIGHPSACAGGLAVVNAMLNRKLPERVVEMGEKLKAALQERFGQHPHVGDIRGRGLFLGLELVKDRDTKETLDPALKTHAKIKKHAFEAGLICYPMGGTIDGKHGDHVMLAPPFIMEDGHIDEIVSKLGDAIEASL